MPPKFPITIQIQNGEPILVNEYGGELEWNSAYVLLRMLEERYQPHYQIYLGYSKKRDAYKIGFSHNPQRRVYNLSIEIIHVIGFHNRYEGLDAERELLLCFNPKRVNGEWFKLDEQDIEYIKQFRVAADFRFERLHPEVENLINRPKSNMRFRRTLLEGFDNIVYSPERIQQIEDDEGYFIKQSRFNLRHQE